MLEAATIRVEGCHHTCQMATLCFQGDATVPRPDGSARCDGDCLLRRGADPVRPRGTILTMAILTLAILAMAILAMAILAMAVDHVRHPEARCNPTRPRCDPVYRRLQVYAPRLQPHVSRLQHPMRLGCNLMHACRRTVARRRSSCSAAWHVQMPALAVLAAKAAWDARIRVGAALLFPAQLSCPFYTRADIQAARSSCLSRSSTTLSSYFCGAYPRPSTSSPPLPARSAAASADCVSCSAWRSPRSLVAWPAAAVPSAAAGVRRSRRWWCRASGASLRSTTRCCCRCAPVRIGSSSRHSLRACLLKASNLLVAPRLGSPAPSDGPRGMLGCSTHWRGAAEPLRSP